MQLQSYGSSEWIAFQTSQHSTSVQFEKQVRHVIFYIIQSIIVKCMKSYMKQASTDYYWCNNGFTDD